MKRTPDRVERDSSAAVEGAVHFSRLVGSRAFLAGRLAGRLRDLAVVPRGDRWHVVAARIDERVISEGRLEIDGSTEALLTDAAGPVWLGASVLDRQVVDVHDLRVTRVSDLVLVPGDDGQLDVVAVELGAAAIVRRLGLPRLAARLDAGTLPLDRLHVASAPASTLTLDAPRERLRELEIAPLDRLADRLSWRAVLPHRQASRRIRAVRSRRLRARRFWRSGG